MTYSRDAILFAEDLMKYIFEKFGLNYVEMSKYEIGKFPEDIGISPFRLVIGNAVHIGISNNLYELSAMFRQEFQTTLDASLFKNHVMKLAPDWFPEGYHPICFVEFCIMVSSAGITYHNAGYQEISACAVEVIATVLTQQILQGEFNPKDGWDKLVKVSTELVILDRQNQLCMGKVKSRNFAEER